MTDDTTGTETAGEAWKCPECEGRTVQCTGCGFVEDAIYAPAAPTEARGLGERVAALADRMAPAVSGTPLDCKNTLLAEAAAPETEGQR